LNLGVKLQLIFEITKKLPHKKAKRHQKEGKPSRKSGLHIEAIRLMVGIE